MRVEKVYFAPEETPFLWNEREGRVEPILELDQVIYSSRTGLHREGFVLVPDGWEVVPGCRVDCVPPRLINLHMTFVIYTWDESEWRLVRHPWDFETPKDGWREFVCQPPWWADTPPLRLFYQGEPLSPRCPRARQLSRTAAWEWWVWQTREAAGPVRSRLPLNSQVRSLKPGELRVPFYRDPQGRLWEVAPGSGDLCPPDVRLRSGRLVWQSGQYLEKDEAQEFLAIVRDWSLPWGILEAGGDLRAVALRGPGQGPDLDWWYISSPAIGEGDEEEEVEYDSE